MANTYRSNETFKCVKFTSPPVLTQLVTVLAGVDFMLKRSAAGVNSLRVSRKGGGYIEVPLNSWVIVSNDLNVRVMNNDDFLSTFIEA